MASKNNIVNNGLQLDKVDDASLDDIEFSSELSISYMEYAMSVILSRAIPDIRDGFKVAQRRILYSMYESGNTIENRFVKCARIIGNVSGKYHPHGEVSIYEAMVRLAQSFSLYVPLINGQGNFGSIDGDGPAAQRYTEARLSKAASLLIDNIHPSLLSMRKNYDASLLEPIFLPCCYPNVLINGNSGIAVGFTANIPSHNPKEVFDALNYMLNVDDYEQVVYDDIRSFILGPDFPNKCLIDNFNLDSLYRIGKGTVTTSSKVVYDDVKHEVIINGLSHGVKKMRLIKSIVDCINEKVLHGIIDIIDDSVDVNYKIRVVLDPGVNGHVVARRLTKYTLCSNSVGCVFRFIVNNKPAIVPFVSVLKHFIRERIKIIKSKLKLEISTRVSSIEKIIALFVVTKTKTTLSIIQEILQSDSITDARARLVEMKFNISELYYLLPKNMQKIDVENFKLTALQIEYLLHTAIIKLNKQKTGDLENIILDHTKKIIANEDILNSDIKLKQIIISELNNVLKHIDRPRLCEIILMDKSLRAEDMEPEKDIILLLHSSQEISYYETGSMKTQKRGGKGRITFESKGVRSLAVTTTHEDVLLFTSSGYGYKVSVFDVYYRGKSLMEIISLRAGDEVISIKPIVCNKQYDNVLILTKNGLIKKHGTRDFNTFNKLGKRICVVGNDDKIIKIVFSNSKQRCVLFSENGKFICLDTEELREFVSRKTKGIKGMKLKENDSLRDVISISEEERDTSVLLIDSIGNAKRLSAAIFLDKISHRNTIGISCINNKKYGFLAACVKISSLRCRIIVATKLGKIMVIYFDEVPETKRLNKGIRLVNLDKNDYIIFADTI